MASTFRLPLVLSCFIPLLSLAVACRDSGHQLGNVLDAAAGAGGIGTTGGAGTTGRGGTTGAAGIGGTTGGAGTTGTGGTTAGTGGRGGSAAGEGGSAGGAAGTGGSAGRGGSGGSSGSGGGGASGGTGGAQVCSDAPSSVCPGLLFCDLDMPGRCNAGAVSGHCISQPDTCPANYAPVCGCDQRTYSNNCARQSAGVQLDHNGACTGDGGADAAPSSCADCNPTTQYCRNTIGGAAGATPQFSGCGALPAACDVGPSCACLSTVSCGNNCMAPAWGPLTVTCLVP